MDDRGSQGALAGALAVAAAAAAAAAAVAAAEDTRSGTGWASEQLQMVQATQGPLGRGPIGYGSVGQGPTPARQQGPTPARHADIDDLTRPRGPAANAVPVSSLFSAHPHTMDAAGRSGDLVMQVIGDDYQLHLDVKDALGLGDIVPVSLPTTPGSTTRETAPRTPGIRRPSKELKDRAATTRRPASAPAGGRRAAEKQQTEPPVRSRSNSKTAADMPCAPTMGTSEPSSAGSVAAGAPGRALRKSASATKTSDAHLKDYRIKEETKSKARQASAEHASGASLYKHLCHMSEANALSEDLGLGTRYRPHRKQMTMRVPGEEAGEEVFCRIYENAELRSEVPLEQFERNFKALKGRWNQLAISASDKEATKVPKSKKAPPRNTAGGCGEPAPKSGVVAKDGRGEDGRPATQMSQEEQDRLQRQIKRVTLETLALADRMWQQLDGLEKDSRPLNPFVIH